jgi:hypothetical protein
MLGTWFPCEGVWQKDWENVLRVKRYFFFPPVPDGLHQRSHLEAATDEPEDSGQLEQVSKVLQEAHQKFFSVRHPPAQDLRVILAAMRSNILAGCLVTFSRVRAIYCTIL